MDQEQVFMTNANDTGVTSKQVLEPSRELSKDEPCFATSAVHANGPQVVMKSFKTFSRLSRKKGMRAYLLMNQHGNGEAGAANEQSAVDLLAAAGLRTDAGSFEPGQGQGKKMARCAVESGKYHILVMFGGDGSINKGVQAVVHADNVSLGVICGGTVNHVSRMFYGNHDSEQWWVNVLRLMQSALTSVDVGTIEAHSVDLVTGETKRVPNALRKTAYFLLSASLGAEATIVTLAPQRLKYMADQLVPGGGFLVLLDTALSHLRNLRPFPARISNENPADGWTGNARAVIVANAKLSLVPGRADRRWQAGRHRCGWTGRTGESRKRPGGLERRRSVRHGALRHLPGSRRQLD
jgi:diacylglycerol kinase family enzyme